MLCAFKIRMWLRRAAFGLATLAMAGFFAAAAAEQTYTVRRGDTLWGIARKTGISVARLAERNGLSKSYHVYTGQRLMIPTTSAQSTKTSPGPALPGSIQRAIDRANVKPGRWKYIVIHHSGVDSGTMKGMDRYHREVRHMENGLAYHFVIGNGHGMGDGEIAASRRWTRQQAGGHLISEKQNQYSIGICLVGNFDQHKPTPKQMQRLTALVRALMRRCRLSIDSVKTHQQINVVHTRCPGTHFPLKTFLASLKASGGNSKP